ncbi:MAG: hypothetical protein ABIJ56_18900, partial [Pseudomonadota bacterium]
MILEGFGDDAPSNAAISKKANYAQMRKLQVPDPNANPVAVKWDTTTIPVETKGNVTDMAVPLNPTNERKRKFWDKTYMAILEKRAHHPTVVKKQRKAQEKTLKDKEAAVKESRKSIATANNDIIRLKQKAASMPEGPSKDVVQQQTQAVVRNSKRDVALYWKRRLNLFRTIASTDILKKAEKERDPKARIAMMTAANVVKEMPVAVPISYENQEASKISEDPGGTVAVRRQRRSPNGYVAGAGGYYPMAGMGNQYVAGGGQYYPMAGLGGMADDAKKLTKEGLKTFLPKVFTAVNDAILGADKKGADIDKKIATVYTASPTGPSTKLGPGKIRAGGAVESTPEQQAKRQYKMDTYARGSAIPKGMEQDLVNILPGQVIPGATATWQPDKEPYRDPDL